MNIALVIGGGTGSRTGQYIPKQFIHINEKPVIIYTLEKFQHVKEIDAIAVVCLEDWQGALSAYALQYGISKLKWIVPGGNTGQESIFKGLAHLQDKCGEDDIVIIHDGIRPMVEERVILSCLEVCREHGNGITALPVYEQIFTVKDDQSTEAYIQREKLRILQTPQAYRYGTIWEAYQKGFAENIGIQGSSYANTLMADLGHTLYFAEGSTKNIKITTKDDIEIFRAMLSARKGKADELL